MGGNGSSEKRVITENNLGSFGSSEVKMEAQSSSEEEVVARNIREVKRRNLRSKKKKSDESEGKMGAQSSIENREITREKMGSYSSDALEKKMGGDCSSERRDFPTNLEFVPTVLSWSVEDIFNDNLYKDQVEKIPDSFESTEQYFGSYLLPLLEETRAEMRSSMEIIDTAPYAEVTYFKEAKLRGTSLYNVNVDSWRNRFSDLGREPYKTLTGDVFLIVDAKPETASDLQGAGRTWTFALVTNISEDAASDSFEVKAPKNIASRDEKQKTLFVVYLMNLSSNRRIWDALHLKGNLTIVKQVLHNVVILPQFACGGNYIRESALEDVAAQFKDIPDSFVDILPKEYPLVITLQKFLIMLDKTIGYSFFDKFLDARKVENAPVVLRNLIRTREVNYEKFCLTYWPQFKAKLTKKLDSSRVFTEIMSHIKGGLRSGDSCYGILSEEDYISLSECWISTLSRQERQMVYNIFQDYEKMKERNREFDMADLVIDLHCRFQNEKYEGDMMDFVYIDEVQDLTMRQIALFKYVCKNVNEGFVFCGDTAQTIARGVDFRFEDIRCLFYNEFILESKCKTNDGKREKGQISKTFHLSQNFRTHDGVLRLAQSIIDLLYRFFPLFVDMLSPETSLIYGQAPIWLEPEKEDNAIATIFKFLGNEPGAMVGFGAEQVILVRDDPSKNEILKHVGKKALVLTIMECKGLEFQDVFLYNFFGSSPLKSQWRVIYEYMMEKGLLDASWSCTSFSQEKHNILCSELKQLYVAITRTRQRLWICENEEELSNQVVDYWKKQRLVQVRKMDDSLAQAMQVASSPEEWKSRGYKLLWQGNYMMATICFERAHHTYGEKLAKAFGLRQDADLLHGSDPERASLARRQAAEIFSSIGKAEDAADCFYMLHEYEKAGKIPLRILVIISNMILR
ncbi:hypothetical protein CCACVL1_23911 [Corchorus capsularis]|uniref:UvrD-like helicase ATP-binding domain-containing protein n=1 Tax=Corchorus capsularis TaxID=210143 RepID=A0A1R3GRJ5_COCAP|nr:hypothetical protein CCACVL1_23911 [Corchorus capsularis]